MRFCTLLKKAYLYKVFKKESLLTSHKEYI